VRVQSPCGNSAQPPCGMKHLIEPKKLKVGEIRAALQERGLSSEGPKAVLTDRLADALTAAVTLGPLSTELVTMVVDALLQTEELQCLLALHSTCKAWGSMLETRLASLQHVVIAPCESDPKALYRASALAAVVARGSRLPKLKALSFSVAHRCGSAPVRLSLQSVRRSVSQASKYDDWSDKTLTLVPFIKEKPLGTVLSVCMLAAHLLRQPSSCVRQVRMAGKGGTQPYVNEHVLELWPREPPNQGTLLASEGTRITFAYERAFKYACGHGEWQSMFFDDEGAALAASLLLAASLAPSPLAPSTSHHRLEHLDFGRSDMSDAGVTMIAETLRTGRFPALERLEISGEFGSAALAALAALVSSGTVPKLRKLHADIRGVQRVGIPDQRAEEKADVSFFLAAVQAEGKHALDWLWIAHGRGTSGLCGADDLEKECVSRGISYGPIGPSAACLTRPAQEVPSAD